jgi:hypothetical protein
MDRNAEVRAQQDEDKQRAKAEALELYGKIVSGELAREIAAMRKETGDSVPAPTTEELMAAFQGRLVREKIASTLIDGALTARDPQKLKVLRSDPRLSQLSEEIQTSGQGQEAAEQKAEYDVTTLWATLLARSMTMIGKPSVAARKAQRTARSGQLLGDPLLDVAVRKAARNFAGILSTPPADLERDLVRIVRESPEYRQSYAAVVRLLRDMTDEPWATCAACGERNNTPWDECEHCGAERGDTVKRWTRCPACGRKNTARKGGCEDEKCPSNQPTPTGGDSSPSS